MHTHISYHQCTKKKGKKGGGRERKNKQKRKTEQKKKTIKKKKKERRRGKNRGEKKTKQKNLRNTSARAAVPKGAPILCSMNSYTGFAEIQTVGRKRTIISLTDSAFLVKSWQHLKCQLRQGIFRPCCQSNNRRHCNGNATELLLQLQQEDRKEPR